MGRTGDRMKREIANSVKDRKWEKNGENRGQNEEGIADSVK